MNWDWQTVGWAVAFIVACGLLYWGVTSEAKTKKDPGLFDGTLGTGGELPVRPKRKYVRKAKKIESPMILKE